IRCQGSNQCYGHCREKTGCMNGKCINRVCKCYGC
uniref:Potassium channel toxin alpha-KTx 6.17 n=1 Tax=Opisthacanthus cayaporum TaxID=573324 RepID=KAX6H_OPICY|nr:RecName: Full=Potassium channel toxin alpha-KTx 6.17; AltName: Full=Toxin OcyKTx2 [Opisthacanthus cayaporum]